VAFAGVLVATLWLTLLADPTMQQAVGAGLAWTMVAATAAALLLWLYARWLRRAGIIL